MGMEDKQTMCRGLKRGRNEMIAYIKGDFKCGGGPRKLINVINFNRWSLHAARIIVMAQTEIEYCTVEESFTVGGLFLEKSSKLILTTPAAICNSIPLQTSGHPSRFSIFIDNFLNPIFDDALTAFSCEHEWAGIGKFQFRSFKKLRASGEIGKLFVCFSLSIINNFVIII